jgi:hypothetical protein
MRRVCYLIEQFGYWYYMDNFGGTSAQMIPNRLYGWARYIASIEPSVGYPMLRSLSENVPEVHAHSESRSNYIGNSALRVIETLDDL